MSEYRLATVERSGRQKVALVVGERLYDLEQLAGQGRADATEHALQGGLLGLVQAWDRTSPELARLAAEPTASAQLDPSQLALLAPILYPGAIYCAAANYADHMREMGTPIPDKTVTRPYFFLKPPRTTVLAPSEPIRLPSHALNLDWELELAVVIGRPCRAVRRENAMEYVAGYTILIDLSARDVNVRSDWPNFRYDWFQGKGFDGAAPMGPYLVPKDMIRHLENLSLRLWVSGELMQDGNTRDLVFTPDEMIEYLSSFVTLQPGDIIATGTPAGVGRPRGRFLRPGDDLVAEIESLGRLRFEIKEPTSEERLPVA